MHEEHQYQALTFAAANLVQNYRSHTTLLEIPNTLFYQGTLVASADQSQLLPPRWTELEDQSQALNPFPSPFQTNPFLMAHALISVSSLAIYNAEVLNFHCLVETWEERSLEQPEWMLR